MTRELTLTRLRTSEAELRAAGVAALHLFGSVARDEQGPDSDIDLACEIAESRTMGLISFAGIQHALETMLGQQVDLVELSALRPRIRAAAERDMVRVF